jgi:hypothetical protein
MAARLAVWLRWMAVGAAAATAGAVPTAAQFPGADPAAPAPARTGGLDAPFLMTPEDFRLRDLTPAQVDALREYDNRLFAVARGIRDPGLRATTLNRVARSKIIARELDDAHTALAEAGRAALEMPPGLLRDLRLMAITSNLVVLAHEQVVEAVPNSPIMTLGATAAPTRTAEDRDAWLDLAVSEWRSAADLAAQISNPNYRCEQQMRIAIGQAQDALKVGRDAGASETSRPDLSGQGPALFAYADRVLHQAADQASRIDRAVWSDRSLYEVAVAAGRAGLYPRAFRIARSIPRPTPRAEALINIAEAMARESSYIRTEMGGSLRSSAEALRSALETARRNAAAPVNELPDALDELGFGLGSPADEVPLRLEDLAQAAETTRRRAMELAVQAESHEAATDPAGLPTAGAVEARRARQLAARADELGDAIADLRVRLAPELDRARALEEPQRSEALARAIPATDDPDLVTVFDRSEATARAVEEIGEPMVQATTAAYSEAARSVAAVPLPDLRAVSARLLTQSLINVGRFDDARAATALLPDAGHRYAIWGSIAESQGRRGLADSAMRWISTEAPAEIRPRLYRRLEEGILGTVDQIRSQTSGAMGR